MIDHYWESEWNGEGQFIYKTCRLPPKDCEGKIIIG